MSSILSRFMPRGGEAKPADSGTPAAVAAPATRSTGLVGEFLFEEEVSAAKLLSLFKQAFVQVESRGDDRLSVMADNGIRLQVFVDVPRKLIVYAASFGLREAAPMESKLAFANRVNDKVVFVRFSVVDDTTLYSDHHLTFDGGVATASVIGAMRRLARITVQSISDLDSENVVS